MADHAAAANDRHDDDDAEQQNNHPAGYHHRANRTDAQMYHYTGGRAPQHITHVRIHCPLLYEAFHNCRRLLSVDFSGSSGSGSNNNANSLIDNIPLRAFANCISLKRLKLSGIRTIGTAAFRNCSSLAEVEFDELLCSVGYQAFCRCVCLKRIVIVPSFQKKKKKKKLLADENTDSSSGDSKSDDGSPREHHIKIHTDAFDK
ncbi:hypothetical protein ACHAWC_002116, partial [Mediolabrus comicus]